MEDLWSKTQDLLQRMERIIEDDRRKPAPAPIQTETETGTRTARKPYSGLKLEEFRDMSIRERNTLFEQNPEKYEEMIAREKGKVF